MADSLNTASDWHQLAFNKLADWIKTSCFNFVVCLTVLCNKKNKIFCTNVNSQGKQRNEMGVVGKFIQLMS